jgi:DNA-binding IclR family transcriptional regulator
MTRDDAETTRSLKRAFAILRAMGRHPDGMRVTDLQRELRVPRASLYRVINALLSEEMVVQDHATGLYRLGTSAMTLGLFARMATPLIAAAQPVLYDVSRESGQLCELVIAPGGWRVLALDVWHGAEMSLDVHIRPGSSTALRHTYMPGMVFLAFDPSRRLEQYLHLAQTADGRRMLDLSRAPDGDFMEQIERVRRTGYAWARQSGREGVGRVSAPVMQPGVQPPRVAACLGIACASKILTALRAAEWGILLKREAARLENAISV